MALPRPFVICGPSGSGKSTLIKRLMDEFSDCFGFSISHTTRKPRPGEEHGKHYYYVSRDEMLSGIDHGNFIEYAEFSGNIYGTSKKAVKEVQQTGKICVLDIDIQGVRNIKATDLNPQYVAIKPPSIEELEKRLRGRATETEESLQKRLEAAINEMKAIDEEGMFDFIIINDDVDRAYQELRDVLIQDIENIRKGCE